MCAAGRVAAAARGAPDRHQGARPAVHAGRHGALRGGLHKRGNRTDSGRIRRLAHRGRRGVHRGARYVARGAAGHRPARLVLRDGPGGTRGLRRLRRRDRARRRLEGAEGRGQWLEDQARGARRTLAPPGHAGRAWNGHVASSRKIQRRTDRRVGARASRRNGVAGSPRQRDAQAAPEPPDLPDEPLPTLYSLAARALPRRGWAAADRYQAPYIAAVAGRRRRLEEDCSTGDQARRPSSGRRHQELDVYPLHTLRGMARSTRWARCGAAARP